MARVSSAPEDAYVMKSGFIEGWGEVVGAKALVFQFPPAKKASDTRKEGDQDPPALFLALEIQRLNADGTKAPGDPEEKLLKIANPSKMTGQLDDLHPGNCADDNFDNEPTDCGGELGAEGNTLFAAQEGFQLNDKTGWMMTAKSLEEKGFKPAILRRSFFPDLIGLVAEFETVTIPKTGKQQFESSLFGVKSIKVYPYEKGTKGNAAAPKATGKGKPAPAAAKNTSAASAPPSTTQTAPVGDANGMVDLSPEDFLTDLIGKYAAGKKGATVTDLKKLKMEVLLYGTKHAKSQMTKATTDSLTEDFLQVVGMTSGLYEVGDDGKVQFAE